MNCKPWHYVLTNRVANGLVSSGGSSYVRSKGRWEAATTGHTRWSCLGSNCGCPDSDFLREGACLITCSVEYRDADKSLARPGRKQANVSVRMA